MFISICFSCLRIRTNWGSNFCLIRNVKFRSYITQIAHSIISYEEKDNKWEQIIKELNTKNPDIFDAIFTTIIHIKDSRFIPSNPIIEIPYTITNDGIFKGY